MARESKAPVKLSSVVDASRYVNAATAATLTVGIRVRPLVRAEIAKGGRRDIIRVLDGRVVLVLDPDDTKDYLDQVQNRTKEKRYTFDIAFGTSATNRDVYNGTVRDLIGGVLEGINTTVFAYGATGSGKTYTMVGTPQDPGLMVLCLEKIFADRDAAHRDEDFTVTCAYLEVYNEIIFDLLVKSSSPLELREDPELGVVVAGLKHITVSSAAEIMTLLEEGNRRRKTEATDANASSSRSHAVLEIVVKRTPKNHYKVTQLRGKLSLVDLAGSERAAETNNAGQKLRDGANINRSLLALANCINALGKANGKGAAAYVPYRNSKLTRLLKDGLSGNSRTAMVATVSGSSDQYHHSINTLKYADRAKEIKTHVVQNVGTVESHVADYQRIIDNLQSEVQDLRAQLIEREAARPPGVSRARSSEEDLLVLIGKLVEEMNDNIEERINLQKALFEIEDANLYNRHELDQLQEFLDAGRGSGRDTAEARERKAEVLEATRENDRERERFKAEIASNEVARKDIQARVQAIVDSNQSAAFLNLLSTFRLQALHLQELKFQMAVRDQIIGEQRQVISNLWKIIDKSGLPKERVMAIAKAEGILMDGLAGGDGGPPTVGPVPLSEALKAVKEEMGLPELRVTPGLGPAVARRASERPLRYRAWPASSPGIGGSSADGRCASADASPYHSGDEGGGASDDDSKSIRSDKSPLRGRGPSRRQLLSRHQSHGPHSQHHPQQHYQQSPPPPPPPPPDQQQYQGGNGNRSISPYANGNGNGSAYTPPPPPLQHQHSEYHYEDGAGANQQNYHRQRTAVRQQSSGVGEEESPFAAAAAPALARAPAAAGAAAAGGGGSGNGGGGGGGPRRSNGRGAGPGPSSGAAGGHAGFYKAWGGGPGRGHGAAGVAAAVAAAAMAAAARRGGRIPGHQLGGRKASEPLDLPSHGPYSHQHSQHPQPPSGPRLENIKSGRRAGQQRAKPPSELAEAPPAAGGGGGGYGEGAGPGPASSPRDWGDVGGGGGGSGGGLPPDGRMPYGRRRHTVAHDAVSALVARMDSAGMANGGGGGGSGGGGGGGGSRSGQDPGDDAFGGFVRVGPDAERGPAMRQESISLLLVPPQQAPLNERLARLKGRLSSAAALAALPLPGEAGRPLPPAPVR